MIDDLATRLLEAQIAFARKQLRDTAYHALVIDEVDHALAVASELTLAEAVTPDMIKAVAAKYAVQVPVEGAIPELVGEIAGRLHRHPVNETTLLEEVIDSHSFEKLLITVTEMDLTRRVLQAVSESPVTEDAVASVLHAAATSAADDATRALARNAVTRTVAGAAARALRPALPTLGQRADAAARRGVRFALRRVVAAEGDETLADAIRDSWRRQRGTAVAEYRGLLTDGDLEDVVVLIFEFWRTFRDTDYFRALLDEGIDHVFDKYGDASLYELLAELGVGREDMIEEALRFGPPVIATLDERGVIEDLLRRRLTPFFESEEYRAAIG
ncbi:hypothetical protein TPB0596_44730 [Tsukamurella pulmonis]|uniref:hypothetical protein n=1 Tax=Tsukamurella pulmonis TaxID=47312 RepID=UPI001EDCDDCB|nr:hypothetical protein [Tsukamurella pulmonis]BDD84710.1 hypothetical protein TPB0596_44730 [Tsukamurella pulmonis]